MGRVPIRGFAFLALGVGALSVAVLKPGFFFLPVALALGAFLAAATSFSYAGQLARSLPSFVGRTVSVTVWGQPLQASGGSPLEVDSIRAFSAGLLVYMRAGPGKRRTLLKIAQPGAARLESSRLEIGNARYVSWGGVKLESVAGHPALALVITQ